MLISITIFRFLETKAKGILTYDLCFFDTRVWLNPPKKIIKSFLYNKLSKGYAKIIFLTKRVI